MKSDSRMLLSHAGRTLLFVVMVILPVALLYLDIHWLHDGVGEWSLVELTQLGFLAGSVLAFAKLARRRAEDRAFAVLAAGLFACMLIRELDAVWDLLFHGCWQLLVSLTAAACLLYGWRDRQRALSALVRFLATRAGTVMTIGVVLLLCYSRLIGLTGLWHGLLGEQYVRVFKNAVEEGTELLGYTLILAASLGYLAQRVRAGRAATQAAGTLQDAAGMRRR